VTADQPVLEVDGLVREFDTSTSVVERVFGESERLAAVDGVDLELQEDEVVGIIGESGCGKSTLLEVVSGLQPPTRGTIRFRGEDTAGYSKAEWKAFRSNVQIIFQDPFNSLDPKLTVKETVEEPLAIHGMDDRDERIREALRQVELQPPERYLHQLPKQLSGGEKQRVSIARALVVEPDVILADEPVSMLDVSTQSAVLTLLSDLVEDLGVSILYISHDLSTVATLCDRVSVMYLGRIVETAPTRQLIDEPLHPYTRALIDAVPVLDPDVERQRTQIEGVPPDPTNLGEGCRFRDRCPDRMEICERTPAFASVDGERNVACHLHYDHDEYERGGEPAAGQAASGGDR
jgi:peptide/nickel transport system ATP-binding protein